MIILTHLSYSLDGLPKTSLEIQSHFYIIWRKVCSVIFGVTSITCRSNTNEIHHKSMWVERTVALVKSFSRGFFQTFPHNHLALNNPPELGTLSVAFFSKQSINSIFWVANICRINLIFQVDKNFGVTLSEERLLDWNTKAKRNVPWQCKG